MARPGRPPAAMATARACAGWAASRPMSRSVSASMGIGARRSRAERESTVGSNGAASSAQRTRQVAGPGLLERLEQGVLGVEVETMCRGDDGDPEAAFHGRQRQVGGEALHLPDADLLAGTLWLHEVEVGVVVGGYFAAGRGNRGRVAQPGRRPGTAARPRGRGQGWSCPHHAAPPTAAHVVGAH